MKIVVIAETHVGEHRVALVPDIAAKLVASGFEVVMEADAGEQADTGELARAGGGESAVLESSQKRKRRNSILRRRLRFPLVILVWPNWPQLANSQSTSMQHPS